MEIYWKKFEDECKLVGKKIDQYTDCTVTTKYVTELMTDTGMPVQFHCTAVINKERGKVNRI